MSGKEKRKLTPEHLEKLRVAREKANEVRSKQSLVKKAEKEEVKQKKQQELESKYKLLTQKPPTDVVKEVKQVEDKHPPTTATPRQKVKKVFEIDSEDGSSSSSSDDEYDVSPIKEKYRQKYKNKYASRYAQQPQPYNPQQDAVTIAKYNIQSKVNQEVRKMAMASLFG